MVFWLAGDLVGVDPWSSVLAAVLVGLALLVRGR